MGVVDAHCDAISKMLQDERADFASGRGVTASLARLAEGGVRLQFFAVYLPETLRPHRFEQVLRSIALYGERVLARPEMAAVRRRKDLAGLVPGRRIGALLSLEGVDAVPGEPWAIRLLFSLGVRAIGITWNNANWAADGAGETRGGGLTRAGRRLVAECNALGIVVDVSHLSERAFWDVAECAARPFIASHSNAYDLCPHPRNLKNEQIDRLIAAGGMIGLAFVPFFLVPPAERPARAADVLRHLEFVCARGGHRAVGIGSDFDGFDTPVPGLEHPGKFGTLRDLILKRFPPDVTDGVLGGNWLRFLARELPE